MTSIGWCITNTLRDHWQQPLLDAGCRIEAMNQQTDPPDVPRGWWVDYNITRIAITLGSERRDDADNLVHTMRLYMQSPEVSSARQESLANFVNRVMAASGVQVHHWSTRVRWCQYLIELNLLRGVIHRVEEHGLQVAPVRLGDVLTLRDDYVAPDVMSFISGRGFDGVLCVGRGAAIPDIQPAREYCAIVSRIGRLGWNQSQKDKLEYICSVINSEGGEWISGCHTK